MFLVFEGMDGSGKSNQARLLAEHLRSVLCREVLIVREPGGTPLGENLRTLILEDAARDLAPETELFLFMAARSHLVRSVIRPALAAGRIVISDRFLWSSVVYQSTLGAVPGGSTVSPEDVLALGKLATAGLLPDRTFIIDVDPETAFARVKEPNRMEGRGLEFQRRVRAGFLRLAGQYPDRSLVIDGRGTMDEVHARVVAALKGLS